MSRSWDIAIGYFDFLLYLLKKQHVWRHKCSTSRMNSLFFCSVGVNFFVYQYVAHRLYLHLKVQYWIKNKMIVTLQYPEYYEVTVSSFLN